MFQFQAMNAEILILQAAPVIGTMTDLRTMSREEILAKAKPKRLCADGFEITPFLFLRTRTKTHVFTGHYKNPAYAADAAQAAKRVFGVETRIEPWGCPILLARLSDEGPGTEETAPEQPQLSL